MTPSQKWLLLTAAGLGFISVAAGAFGAHALKNRLSAEMLAIFEVGTRYQMYHALAMCMAVGLAFLAPGQWALASAWMFFVGTLIFSGSLYVLALTGVRSFGAITPIGGVFLLIGWICFGLAVYKA